MASKFYLIGLLVIVFIWSDNLVGVRALVGLWIIVTVCFKERCWRWCELLGGGLRYPRGSWGKVEFCRRIGGEWGLVWWVLVEGF